MSVTERAERWLGSLRDLLAEVRRLEEDVGEDELTQVVDDIIVAWPPVSAELARALLARYRIVKREVDDGR